MEEKTSLLQTLGLEIAFVTYVSDLTPWGGRLALGKYYLQPFPYALGLAFGNQTLELTREMPWDSLGNLLKIRPVLGTSFYLLFSRNIL